MAGAGCDSEIHDEVEIPSWKIGERVHFFHPGGFWTRGVIEALGSDKVWVNHIVDNTAHSFNIDSMALQKTNHPLIWGEPYFDFEAKKVSSHLSLYNYETTNVIWDARQNKDRWWKVSDKYRADCVNDYRWKQPDEFMIWPGDLVWIYLDSGYQQKLSGGWTQTRVISVQIEGVELMIPHSGQRCSGIMIPHIHHPKKLMWQNSPHQNFFLHQVFLNMCGEIMVVNVSGGEIQCSQEVSWHPVKKARITTIVDSTWKRITEEILKDENYVPTLY